MKAVTGLRTAIAGAAATAATGYALSSTVALGAGLYTLSVLLVIALLQGVPRDGE